MPRLLSRVVSVDVRRDALYWVESIATPRGPRQRRWGQLQRLEGETDSQLGTRLQETFEGAELVLAIRDPDLVVERLDLPGLSRGDARRVARRRLHELAEGLPPESNADFMLSTGGAPLVGWLVACADARATETREPWEACGGEVRQLVGVPLALASLVQLMDPPPPGELLTIFDLGDGYGSCVVVDARGWVFSREIAHKGAAGDEEELSEEDRCERLATEVRRTIHYVESVLRLGTVTGMLLAGSDPDPADTAQRIGASLNLPVRPIGEALVKGPAAGAAMGAAVAIGLATVAERGEGDLLCERTRRQRANRWARRHLLFAATIAGLLAGAGALHHVLSWSAARDQIVSLDEHWEAGESTRRALHSVGESRERARAVRDALGLVAAPRPDWRTMLDSLGLLLPDAALVENLRVAAEAGEFRAQLDVEFRGENLAQAAESAARFAKQLRRTPLWFVRGSEQRELPPAAAAAVPDARVRYRIEADLVPVLPEGSLSAEEATGA